MRNIWTIARREYKHYFISPIAYAVALMILLILGIIFYANIVAASYQQFAPDIQIVLGPLVTMLLFTTPAITMRSLAEEQKMGTLELLLTAPITDWELIVGKWLGGVMFLTTILIVTWIYPLILNQLVSPGIDQGILITSYIGVFLISCTFIAIGVAISSLFSNQIAAFFATLGVLLAFWMISYPAQAMGATGGLSASILIYLDLAEHLYGSFLRGAIEIKDIIYYFSFIFLALFLGKISIEIRR